MLKRIAKHEYKCVLYPLTKNTISMVFHTCLKSLKNTFCERKTDLHMFESTLCKTVFFNTAEKLIKQKKYVLL